MLGQATTGIDAMDAERARFFALLGRLLSAPPDTDLLARLRGLRGNPTPLGQALAGLAAAAASTADRVEEEYFALFIGVGRGELLPYGSYYMTGFLHDRPLADLRDSLARLGIARAAGVQDPEDHIGFCLDAMAGLLDGRFASPAAADPFFARHLRPWAGRFFADLEAAGAARFYRAVGALGRVVFDIEQAAAELPA